MTTVKLTSILAGLLTATLAWAAEQNVSSQDDLAHAFAAPPHEAKPWVYWWFLGGYGNPEGMARDIAAMKEKGIGGVMHMQTINAGGRPLPNEPKMLSPEWDTWFGEMLRVAHESRMTLSASILDGWSHGGWWVGKENGAKQLVYSETQVDGPAAIASSLPQPFTQLGLYRDVAVVVFKEQTPRPPAPLEVQANNVQGGYCGEENWPARHATDSDPETYWRTQKPCAGIARNAGLALRPAPPGGLRAGGEHPEAGPAEAEIQASDEGKEYRPVLRFMMQPGERKPWTSRR